MSKYSNTIEYKLKTSADLKGIEQLQKSLTQVNTTLNQMHFDVGADHEGLDNSLARIQTLQDALTKTFNPKLGIINGEALQKELGNIGIDTLISDLNKAGASGQIAINNLVGGLAKVHTNLNTISNTIDKVINTFGNTVRWGITASIFETMSNNLRRSVEFVRDLDTSLNNIQIVSGQSSEQMKSFAEWASQAGQNLGRSTIEIVDAAQIFAQNGFNVEDQKKLAELTNEVANVTQQSSETASSQITSLMNGYKLSIDEAKDALDAMALVAAESASDLNELATAETRVASVAHDLGVSQNQLTAQLSTMVSVTRQAPETVGNALRSIYARIGDLKLGGSDEAGVDLGKVSGALSEIGINVLDANGDMREMGTIIEELMEKWDNLGRAQQQALAITVAGKQQVNMFQTLMSNADMYRETLETAEGAIGTLDAQQEIYMDSAVAKMQTLSTAGEELINSLFNADSYKPTLDVLTDFVNILTDVVDSLGGGLPVLTAFTTMFLKLGNREIGSSIGEFIFNRGKNKEGEASDRYNRDLLTSLGATEASNAGAYQFARTVGKNITETSVKSQQEYNELIDKTIQAENALKAAQNNRRVDLKKLIEEETRQSKLRENGIKLFIDESGSIKAESTGLWEYISQLQELFDETNIGSSEASKELEKIKADISENDEITDKWKNKLTELIERFEQLEDIIDDSAKQQKILRELSEEGYVDPTDTIRQYNEITGSKQQGLRSHLGDENILNAETLYKQQLETNKDFGIKLNSEDMVRQMMTLTDGLTSLVFAAQSLKSIGEIVSDNSVSNVEKIDKIVSNLAITLPIIVNGVKDLRTGGKVISTLGNAILNSDKLMDILINLENRFPNIANGILAATTSLNGFAAGLISIIGPVAAVAAGIAALVVIIKSIYDEVHKFDIALEEANENLSNTRKNTEDAQNKLSELKTGLEEVKNAKDSFDGLKEGTVEWTDALIKANEQVLKLIETYPELAQYIATDRETGSLSFTEEGMQKVLENQMQTVANNQAIQAQAILDQARAENEKLAHDTNIIWNSGTVGYAYGSGTSTARTLTDNQKIQAATMLAANPGADAKDLVNAKLVTNIADASRLLDSHREALIELGNKIKENTEIARSESQARIQTALSLDENYQELSNNEKEFVNRLADHEFDKDSEEYQEIVKSIEALSEEQQRQQYKEVTGRTDEDIKTVSPEAIKEGLISAGVISAITGENGKLEDYIKQSHHFTSLLVSAVGETGANAFNFKDKSFNFDGIKFTDYLDLKDINFDQINMYAFTKLADMTKREVKNGWEEGLKEVDFSTMDMRLNGEIEDQIYDLQDKMAEALKNIRKDAELTADDYRAFLSESLQESLDAVKISSESVGSVYELLAKSSIDAERAMYGLSEVLSDEQHALQLADVKWLAEQYDDLSEKAEDSLKIFNEINDQSKIKFRLDYEEVEDAYNELMSLYDLASDLQNQSFSLSIDVGADLLDASDNIIEVLDDIVAATSSVEEGFKISADKVEDFAKAFPGILKDYTVTSEGLIQLNEEVVKSTLGVASADAKSVTEAQKVKLKSYADYAQIMAEAYKKRAKDIYDLAEKEKMTDAEAKKIIAEHDRKLTDETIRNAKNLGISITKVSKENATATDEANTDIADQFASMTASADKNITNLGTNTISTFQKMAEAALEVAEAIDAIGKKDASKIINEKIKTLKESSKDPTSYEAYKERVMASYSNTYKPESTAQDREDAHLEHVAKINNADELFTEEERKNLDELFESGAETLKNYGDTLMAEAGSFESMQNLITAKIAQLDAEGVKVPSEIAKIGQPKEEKEKFKSTKEKEELQLETEDPFKDIDTLKDKPDLYERVNAILEKIANQYSRIADEQDRLVGNQYAENIAKQLSLLQQQIKAEEVKLDIQKQEAEMLKSNLEAQGVQFDEAGFITNYQTKFLEMQDSYNKVVEAYDKAQREAQENYIKELNAVKEAQNTIINELIEQYNATKPGSDEEKALKETISKTQKSASESEKAIEEAYKTLQKENEVYYEELLKTSKETLDTFKTDAERYDQLYASEMEDTLSKVEEYKNKIEDLQIDAFRKSIDVGSNVKEIQETMTDIDTLIKTINKRQNPMAKMAASAEKLSYYWNTIDGGKGYFDLQTENMEKLVGLINQYESSGTADFYGENGAALYEDAKKSLDEAKSLLNDYESEISNLESAISEFFQLLIKKIDATMDKFDLFNEKLEHYIGLINMTWGDRSPEALITLYDNIAINANNQIQANERLIDSYRDMQQAFNEDQDEWWDLEDKINSAISNIYDLQEQQVDAINKKLEVQNKKIIHDWETSLLNGQTIDDYADQWEIINRNAEQYLDAIESAYETQKLQNKYQDLANNTKSLNTQQRILDAMQDQLKNLEGQTKLFQYQVDYANAQYDILQKTIALEEARNNKSQLKLRRDRQGNYSYVYSADEEEAKQKAEELLDAQQKAYELSKQYLVSTQENIMSVLQQSKSAIEDILNDTTLTIEEKDEKIKFITDHLQEYLMNESQTFKLAQMNIVWDAVGTVKDLSINTTEDFNNIMADLTKAAIAQIVGNSNMTADQQEAKIRSLLTQMRAYIGDSVVSFVNADGAYVATSINDLLNFSNLSTNSFLNTMRTWTNDCDTAFTQIDARWDSSAYSWLDNLRVIKDGNRGLVFDWDQNTNKIIIANNALKDNAARVYRDWAQAVNQAVGYIIGDIGQLTAEIGNTTSETDQLKQTTENFFNDLNGDIGTLKDFVRELELYQQQIQELESSVYNFANLCQDLADKLIQKQWEYYDVNEQIIDQLNSINNASNQSSSSNSGSSTGSNTQQSTQQNTNNQNSNNGKRFVRPGDLVGYYGVYHEDSWGQGRQGNYHAGESNAVRISTYSGIKAGGTQEVTGDYYVHLEETDGSPLGWVDPNQLFNSGGYTGQWNDGVKEADDGKLAFLHQKELVLNASDTENILKAVDIMREVLSSMSTITFDKINNIDFSKSKQDVNQNIQIEAHFPNVTNENEIRNALLNLTSNVAQFAHRQK